MEGDHNLIQLPANWICILYPMEIVTIWWWSAGRPTTEDPAGGQEGVLSAKIT